MAYLSDIGEGASRQEAENNALGNLSRIFGVEVSVDSTARQSYSEDGGGAKTSRSAETLTGVSSGHKLVNARIDRTHSDGRGHYAVAVIPVPETARLLEEKITANGRVINQYYEAGLNDPDLIYRFSFLDMALLLARENENLIHQLKIIQPLRTVSVPVGADSIRLERTKTLGAMTFKVHLEHDPDGQLEWAVRQALSALGFRISRRGVFVITDTPPGFTPRGQTAGMAFMEYRYQLSLVDADGESWTRFTFSGKAGSRQGMEEARRQGEILLRRDVEEGFADRFVSFLDELLEEL